MMCGTPVVASPWGAFNETVVPGVSGYPFHTLAEGVTAVEQAMLLDRTKVREHAERYSIWNVRHEYDRWLKQLHGLWGPGWVA
jgi:glycosyltransferase involved in cell wall biosynthesis